MPVRIFKQEIHDDIIVIAEYARQKWKKFFSAVVRCNCMLTVKKRKTNGTHWKQLLLSKWQNRLVVFSGSHEAA